MPNLQGPRLSSHLDDSWISLLVRDGMIESPGCSEVYLREGRENFRRRHSPRAVFTALA